MSTPQFTLLDIVKSCNNSPDIASLLASGDYYRLLADSGIPVGLIHRRELLPLEIECNKQELPVFMIDHAEKSIKFNEIFDSEKQRSAALASLLNTLCARDAWPTLRKWRNELYPICCGIPNSPLARIERAASTNFGIHAFGIHLNGIVRSPDDGKVKMWIAKRAATKQTFPGYLDNTVAGGIGNGDSVFDTVVKECAEEAGIPADIASRAQSCGVIQYMMLTELGLQPETQYVFDLELPIDVIPKPNDGEVEGFYLWTMDEVLEKVRAGQFKPNCAVCVVDFMIRHGFLTAENEPDYLEIIDNMHVKLPFPGV
ncbi:hypothetical protein EV175_006066 [Coemansia sp. RSA 1933]|nr:hypothetical protein EV175_006066 [Coemansia sp. RSA 1933]